MLSRTNWRNEKIYCSNIRNFWNTFNKFIYSGTIDLSEKDVWTKERIVKAVKDDAEYLQGEAQRNYGSSLRR